MILVIAWRNIWRNKLRSGVIITAIALGILAGDFTWAFYRGMVLQRMQSAIMTESAHIQVHHRNYLTNPDQKFYISDADSIAVTIGRITGVKAVTKRIVVNAMAASAETGAGVRIIGISPAEERQVTNLFSKVREGNYLDERKMPVVIGEKLAKKLSIRLRSKLVITLQTMDGTLTSGLFRVTGLYRTSNSVYDETNLFVRKSDLAGLIDLNPGSCQEIAILLRDDTALGETVGLIQSRFPDLDTRTWKELMPEVNLIGETMDIYMYFFMGVILAALVFGIINTMLMAIMERVKELGMLMAVGMNRFRVFLMILLETVLLCLTGGITGMVIGYFTILYFNHTGIDLAFFAEGIEKLGFESVVFPVSDYDIDIKIAVMVLAAGILAAVYPAWKAIQLRPSEALRIDI